MSLLFIFIITNFASNQENYFLKVSKIDKQLKQFFVLSSTKSPTKQNKKKEFHPAFLSKLNHLKFSILTFTRTNEWLVDG